MMPLSSLMKSPEISHDATEIPLSLSMIIPKIPCPIPWLLHSPSYPLDLPAWSINSPSCPLHSLTYYLNAALLSSYLFRLNQTCLSLRFECSLTKTWYNVRVLLYVVVVLLLLLQVLGLLGLGLLGLGLLGLGLGLLGLGLGLLGFGLGFSLPPIGGF